MRRYIIEDHECIRVVVVCQDPFFCASYNYGDIKLIDLEDDMDEVWGVYILEQINGTSTKSFSKRLREKLRLITDNNTYYIDW